MHFLLAWQIEELPNREETERDVLECFQGYKFAKATETAYVIGIDQEDEYKNITDKLDRIAQDPDRGFEYVHSLPVTGGGYNGWIKTKRWADINRVSGVGND